MKSFFTLILSLQLFAFSTARAQSWVIALKPDKNPEMMLKEKGKLESELSKKLGHKVQVIIPTSSAVILQGFANGTIDLGFLSSLDMVNAEKNQLADLLLAGKIKGQTSYDSLWLTRSDAKFKSIADLKNKPVAFASRTSTSGYLIPYWNLIKLDLVKEKQDPEQFFGAGKVFYGSGYMTAVQRLLDGTADAVAVSDYVFEADKHMTAEQKSKVRVLQRQGPVPTHVLAVRKSLSEADRKKLKSALLNLNNSPELRDRVFTSEIVEVDASQHIATTKEALALTGLSL